jgi:hypothetical protein
MVATFFGVSGRGLVKITSEGTNEHQRTSRIKFFGRSTRNGMAVRDRDVSFI